MKIALNYSSGFKTISSACKPLASSGKDKEPSQLMWSKASLNLSEVLRRNQHEIIKSVILQALSS